MSEENPPNDQVAAILENVPCGANEEDLIRAGYHSRDELVSGLVGASYALWQEVDRVGFPLGIKPATLVTAMGNLMGVLSTTPEAFKTYADYEAAEAKAKL